MVFFAGKDTAWIVPLDGTILVNLGDVFWFFFSQNLKTDRGGAYTASFRFDVPCGARPNFWRLRNFHTKSNVFHS